MDRQRRLELATDRFVAVFRHALANSRAYQDIYRAAGLGPEDVRSLEDLKKLPIVRAEDMVKRQKEDPPFGGFLAVEPEKIRRIHINPGLLFQPGEREYSDTSWAEALCAVGFGPGDRILNTFNYHLWSFGLTIDEAIKMIGATLAPTGVGNTFMQVRIMRLLKLNGFVGTPSFLMELSQRAGGMGLDSRRDLFLEKAMVTAEVLPESLRRRLEDELDMTIRQAYGTAFLGCLGYECPYATGLHVPHDVLVEAVDPETGRPVPPGSAGEIVATNFSTVHPLIRLSTGDLSMFTEEACPCGRSGPMLKKVLGRIDQATKVKGTFIHPWQTDEVISRHEEVFKYQVVVTRQDHSDVMTFWVELMEDAAEVESIQRRIERDIKELLTIKGVVKVVPRGTIPDFHDKIVDRRRWD